MSGRKVESCLKSLPLLSTVLFLSVLFTPDDDDDVPWRKGSLVKKHLLYDNRQQIWDHGRLEVFTFSCYVLTARVWVFVSFKNDSFFDLSERNENAWLYSYNNTTSNYSRKKVARSHEVATAVHFMIFRSLVVCGPCYCFRPRLAWLLLPC